MAIQNWEHHLLLLAREVQPGSVHLLPKAIEDLQLLSRAYSYCDFVTAQHSRTFFLATCFLPSAKRKAIRALYAFCRTSDDLIDCPHDDGDETWDTWRRNALLTVPPSQDLLSVAWADTRRRYPIPLRYIEQFLEGVSRDKCQKAYATFDELAGYAYRVASTVGLMSMHIIGFSSDEAIPYAIKLGVALQMTNILRDVQEDFSAGRIYLPLEELEAFHLSEANLEAGQVDENWRNFMRYQIARNRHLYHEAYPGIRLLNKDGRFAVAAAADLYQEILSDIEAHDYDVFHRRCPPGRCPEATAITLNPRCELRMREFDFIIVGGGVSGLSLAYHLKHSPFSHSSILIVDAGKDAKSDHALSFWSSGPSPFDSVIFHSWQRLRIRADNFDSTFQTGRFRYDTIRLADYRSFIRQDLSSSPGIEFLEGWVAEVKEDAPCPNVEVNGETYFSQWVFDSRFSCSSFHPDPSLYTSLQQHFRGWQIETDVSKFDPEVATLFDFRVDQKNELRFFYLLPFSDRRALVECVLLSNDNYDVALGNYIEHMLGIHDYRILAKEGGVTPLTSYLFPRRVGSRVMSIGIAGGRVKPSSGYAFTRIQHDSLAIVNSLTKTGSPFRVRENPVFYRYCDATLLQIMSRRGSSIKPIFTPLFKKNPIERVLRFLDETNPTAENLALMASLPLPLFWKGLVQAAIKSF